MEPRRNHGRAMCDECDTFHRRGGGMKSSFQNKTNYPDQDFFGGCPMPANAAVTHEGSPLSPPLVRFWSPLGSFAKPLLWSNPTTSSSCKIHRSIPRHAVQPAQRQECVVFFFRNRNSFFLDRLLGQDLDTAAAAVVEREKRQRNLASSSSTRASLT